MRMKNLAAIVAAGTLAFALGACGDNSDDSSSGDSGAMASPTSMSTPTGMATPTAGGAMADGQFGAGCSAVPTDPANPGSFSAMAKVPVATAASGNPVLSTLVTAVKQANLVDSLNTAPAITVFAPANDAFAKVPRADLDKLLSDNTMLTEVLTYHVVQGKLTPEKLAGTHKTLQGGELTVAGSGQNFTVNGNSMVICGNVQTANATVYIVDTVLMPKS